MRPQYLRVRNWEKFQHYKDRRPPWIKYHVELLDDYELTHMEYATQLVYDRLLLLAARTDNNIPHDPEHIGRQVSIKSDTITSALQTLLDAGFLTLAESKRAASKAIARRKHDAIPRALARDRGREEAEAEAETETEKDIGVHDLSAEQAVKAVYDHWRNVRRKTDARYDRVSPQRRQKIKSRLAEFTVDQLTQALDNVQADTWPERDKHDDIAVLFKSREAVDRWLEMTTQEDAGDGPRYARYS